MGEISRAALFGKLNSVAYKAIEAATVFCKLRGNPYVELAHWFHQLLQLQDSDLHRIIRQFNVQPARLARDLTEALDRLPRGSTSITDLSSHVEEAVERGWVYGSLMFGESQVRTGYLVLGILKTPSLRHALLGLSGEFDKIKAEALSERFDEYVGDSPENALSASDGFNAGAVPGEASGAMAPSAMGKQEALKRFTVDLTEQARSGKLDPIVGRDEEIRQLVDILMRRRQNNPILTGEAGVGKTAVVEGFALRIVAGDVPPALKDVELRSLDVGLLQAGAGMKGEFEQRLRQVVRIAGLCRQVAAVMQLRRVGDQALVEQARGAATAQCGEARRPVVIVRAVMADGRPCLGPGTIKQGQQAMVEHIQEALAGAVGVVALALTHVLGDVQRQRAVGAAEAEEELLQPCRLAFGPRFDRGQCGRRKGAIGLLPETQRVIRQAQGVPQAWQVRRFALDAPQRLEEVIFPGLLMHRIQGTHRVGRRPGLAFHRMISPRSVVRITVSVKLLIDT